MFFKLHTAWTWLCLMGAIVREYERPHGMEDDRVVNGGLRMVYLNWRCDSEGDCFFCRWSQVIGESDKAVDVFEVAMVEESSVLKCGEIAIDSSMDCSCSSSNRS